MNTLPPDDFSFYEMLDEVAQQEPATSLDPELVAAIGIATANHLRQQEGMKRSRGSRLLESKKGLCMHTHSPAGQQPVHRRRLPPALFAFVVIVLGLGLACGRSAEKPAAQNTVAATTDPDQLLRQMSEKLARANKLTFRVGRRLDAALVEGRDVAENARLEISVSRPGKFLSKSDSQDNARQFVFDGHSLSVYDETMNLYATVLVPGTIDEVVAKISEEYGFTPPLAEFILNDPYAALGRQIQSKAYKNKETVAGVEWHHLSLGSDVADSEVWIGADDLLPRKLVATFKDREGGPKLQADFSDWNLAATLDDKLFAFVAPKDAESVDMLTEEQVNATARPKQPRRKSRTRQLGLVNQAKGAIAR